MKTTFRTLTTLILILSITKVFSQNFTKENTMTDVKNETPGIKDLVFDVSFKNIGGKVYIMWNIPGQNAEGLYKIESSHDVKNFRTINAKYLSGNDNVQLLYSFIDEHPLEGTYYYKLSKSSMDGQNVVSNIYPMNPSSPEIKMYSVVMFNQ